MILGTGRVRAKTMSEHHRLAGKTGGLVTVMRYGRDHMVAIGKLGGRPTWQQALDKACCQQEEARKRARCR